MAICRCSCGAKFNVPDESLGKKAKCKKCGSVFKLVEEEEGVIPIAEDPWPDSDELAQAAATPPAPQPGRSDALGAIRSDESGAAETEGSRGYASDVLWTFLFPTTTTNLVAFLVVWAVVAIVPLMSMCPLVGLFVGMLFTAWYAAYRFAVVQSAAAGETTVPDVNFSGDMVLDMVRGLLAWIGSWAVALLPAFVYLTVALQSGLLTGDEVIDLSLGGLDAMWQSASGSAGLFFLFVCLGIAIWPMMILCIALGGFSALVRIDLIVVTIIKTIPAYFITLVLMFGATLLSSVLTEFAGTRAAAGGGGRGATFGVEIILVVAIAGVRVYADIVMMRLIGLYYHHFKHRFAWSWG